MTSVAPPRVWRKSPTVIFMRRTTREQIASAGQRVNARETVDDLLLDRMACQADGVSTRVEGCSQYGVTDVTRYVTHLPRGVLKNVLSQHVPGGTDSHSVSYLLV